MEMSDAETAGGARLQAAIAGAIDAAGGWIPFSRFMELALYAPGLGYYSAGTTKVGSDPGGGSDFVTAPERTPLFARALARPVAAVLADAAPTILELGGGSGRLAADLLLELEVLGALPERYLLLDVSADFRQRQEATVRRDAPHLADRVRWIDTLPDRLDGVVLANEVLDALPVEVVAWDGSGWSTHGVEFVGPGFRFASRPAAEMLAARSTLAVGDPSRLPVGYTTEMPLALDALIATLASRLEPDAVCLFIDYGFPASEYYHPQRIGGTLMAHRRHHAPPRRAGPTRVPGHHEPRRLLRRPQRGGVRGRAGRRIYQPGRFPDRLRHRRPARRRRDRRARVGRAGGGPADAAVGGRDGRAVQGHRARPTTASADRIRSQRSTRRTVNDAIESCIHSYASNNKHRLETLLQRADTPIHAVSDAATTPGDSSLLLQQLAKEIIMTKTSLLLATLLATTGLAQAGELYTPTQYQDPASALTAR